MIPVISDPWVYITKPNPLARLRLFCFSYAGGGASIYRSWQGKLSPDIEICAVQLPGREYRIKDLPFTQISPLVGALSQALRPYLTGPFIFFGHSMGALVSFELARELRRQHLCGPQRLLVSSHRAPQLPDLDPPIHHLPDAEFMEEVYKLNGTPRNVLDDDEMVQMMLPVLRADFTVCETYIYRRQQPFEFPISVFGGLQDTDVPPEQLEGWREQTRATFKLTLFQGDHFYLKSCQDELLRAISTDLSTLSGK